VIENLIVFPSYAIIALFTETLFENITLGKKKAITESQAAIHLAIY
jgi:hypothetical protein